MMKIPESMQPPRETLKQKLDRLKAEEKAKRALKAGGPCWVVRTNTNQAVLLVVERIGAEEGWIFVRDPDNTLLVFHPLTHRCEGLGRSSWVVYTDYEYQSMKLWREDVLPKLEGLAQHYKNAGNMTHEELKALSAVLELSTKARDRE